MGTCGTAGANGSASAGSADDHNNDNHDVHPPAMCRTGIHNGGSEDAGSARSESERLFELIPQILATFATTITTAHRDGASAAQGGISELTTSIASAHQAGASAARSGIHDSRAAYAAAAASLSVAQGVRQPLPSHPLAYDARDADCHAAQFSRSVSSADSLQPPLTSSSAGTSRNCTPQCVSTQTSSEASTRSCISQCASVQTSIEASTQTQREVAPATRDSSTSTSVTTREQGFTARVIMTDACTRTCAPRSSSVGTVTQSVDTTEQGTTVHVSTTDVGTDALSIPLTSDIGTGVSSVLTASVGTSTPIRLSVSGGGSVTMAAACVPLTSPSAAQPRHCAFDTAYNIATDSADAPDGLSAATRTSLAAATASVAAQEPCIGFDPSLLALAASDDSGLSVFCAVITKCATRMQGRFRMRSCRRQVRVLRLRRLAAVRLQSFYRGQRIRLIARHQRSRAATRIQAAIRSRACVLQLATLRSARMTSLRRFAAASTVQALHRTSAGARHARQLRCHAANAIRRCYARYTARRAARTAMLQLRSQQPPTDLQNYAATLVYAAEVDTALVQERSHSAMRWAEYTEVPSGKVEQGETPAQAARRELVEETGVALPQTLFRPVDVLYTCSSGEEACSRIRGPHHDTRVFYFVAIVRNRASITCDLIDTPQQKRLYWAVLRTLHRDRASATPACQPLFEHANLYMQAVAGRKPISPTRFAGFGVETSCPAIYFHGGYPATNPHIYFEQDYISPFVNHEGAQFYSVAHYVLTRLAIAAFDVDAVRELHQLAAQGSSLDTMLAHYPMSLNARPLLRPLLEYANYCKYRQNVELRVLLLDTGDSTLVEVWQDKLKYDDLSLQLVYRADTGILLSHDAARMGEQWGGDNLQGLALMRVREILQHRSGPTNRYEPAEPTLRIQRRPSAVGVRPVVSGRLTCPSPPLDIQLTPNQDDVSLRQARPFCAERDSLYIQQTRSRGNGVFTLCHLRKDQIATVVKGRRVMPEEEVPVHLEDYVIEIPTQHGPMRLILDPQGDDKFAGTINEASRGEDVNCVIHAHQHSDSSSATGLEWEDDFVVVFYVVRDIPSMAQLLTHYGPAYQSVRERKQYEASPEAGRVLNPADVSAALNEYALARDNLCGAADGASMERLVREYGHRQPSSSASSDSSGDASYVPTGRRVTLNLPSATVPTRTGPRLRNRRQERWMPSIIAVPISVHGDDAPAPAEAPEQLPREVLGAETTAADVPRAPQQLPSSFACAPSAEAPHNDEWQTVQRARSRHSRTAVAPSRSDATSACRGSSASNPYSLLSEDGSSDSGGSAACVTRETSTRAPSNTAQASSNRPAQLDQSRAKSRHVAALLPEHEQRAVAKALADSRESFAADEERRRARLPERQSSEDSDVSQAIFASLGTVQPEDEQLRCALHASLVATQTGDQALQREAERQAAIDSAGETKPQSSSSHSLDIIPEGESSATEEHTQGQRPLVRRDEETELVAVEQVGELFYLIMQACQPIKDECLHPLVTEYNHRASTHADLSYLRVMTCTPFQHLVRSLASFRAEVIAFGLQCPLRGDGQFMSAADAALCRVYCGPVGLLLRADAHLSVTNAAYGLPLLADALQRVTTACLQPPFRIADVGQTGVRLFRGVSEMEFTAMSSMIGRPLTAPLSVVIAIDSASVADALRCAKRYGAVVEIILHGDAHQWCRDLSSVSHIKGDNAGIVIAVPGDRAQRLCYTSMHPVNPETHGVHLQLHVGLRAWVEDSDVSSTPSSGPSFSEVPPDVSGSGPSFSKKPPDAPSLAAVSSHRSLAEQLREVRLKHVAKREVAARRVLSAVRRYAEVARDRRRIQDHIAACNRAANLFVIFVMLRIRETRDLRAHFLMRRYIRRRARVHYRQLFDLVPTQLRWIMGHHYNVHSVGGLLRYITLAMHFAQYAKDDRRLQILQLCKWAWRCTAQQFLRLCPTTLSSRPARYALDELYKQKFRNLRECIRVTKVSNRVREIMTQGPFGIQVSVTHPKLFVEGTYFHNYFRTRERYMRWAIAGDRWRREKFLHGDPGYDCWLRDHLRRYYLSCISPVMVDWALAYSLPAECGPRLDVLRDCEAGPLSHSQSLRLGADPAELGIRPRGIHAAIYVRELDTSVRRAAADRRTTLDVTAFSACMCCRVGMKCVLCSPWPIAGYLNDCCTPRVRLVIPFATGPYALGAITYFDLHGRRIRSDADYPQCNGHVLNTIMVAAHAANTHSLESRRGSNARSHSRFGNSEQLIVSMVAFARYAVRHANKRRSILHDELHTLCQASRHGARSYEYHTRHGSQHDRVIGAFIHFAQHYISHRVPKDAQCRLKLLKRVTFCLARPAVRSIRITMVNRMARNGVEVPSEYSRTSSAAQGLVGPSLPKRMQRQGRMAPVAPFRFEWRGGRYSPPETMSEQAFAVIRYYPLPTAAFLCPRDRADPEDAADQEMDYFYLGETDMHPRNRMLYVRGYLRRARRIVRFFIECHRNSKPRVHSADECRAIYNDPSIVSVLSPFKRDTHIYSIVPEARHNLELYLQYSSLPPARRQAEHIFELRASAAAREEAGTPMDTDVYRGELHNAFSHAVNIFTRAVGSEAASSLLAASKLQSRRHLLCTTTSDTAEPTLTADCESGAAVAEPTRDSSAETAPSVAESHLCDTRTHAAYTIGAYFKYKRRLAVRSALRAAQAAAAARLSRVVQARRVRDDYTRSRRITLVDMLQGGQWREQGSIIYFQDKEWAQLEPRFPLAKQAFTPGTLVAAHSADSGMPALTRLTRAILLARPSTPANVRVVKHAPAPAEGVPPMPDVFSLRAIRHIRPGDALSVEYDSRSVPLYRQFIALLHQKGAQRPPIADVLLKAGLKFGMSVIFNPRHARILEHGGEIGDIISPSDREGVLRDADYTLEGDVICTIEDADGWFFPVDEAWHRHHVAYMKLEHLWRPSPPATLALAQPRQPPPSITVCVGTIGTLCNIIISSAQQDAESLMDKRPIQDWFESLCWWANHLAKAVLPTPCHVAVPRLLGMARHALTLYATRPKNAAKTVNAVTAAIIDAFCQELEWLSQQPASELSTDALRLVTAVDGVRRMDRESLVSMLGAESSIDSIDLVRQLTRQWKVVRSDLDQATLEPAARDRVQFVTQLTALLPLAASLSALVCAADSVDEMLPLSATAVPAEDLKHVHYHHVSDSGLAWGPERALRRVYSHKEITHARWLQRLYRHLTSTATRKRAAQSPFALGAEARRLKRPAKLAPGWSERYASLYFTSLKAVVPVDATWGHSIQRDNRGCWRSRLLRHFMLPWRAKPRNTQCQQGTQLCSEALFAKVRAQMDRVLHVGAFLAQLYEQVERVKPSVIVAGCGGGGANVGAERLGVEHVGIDIKPQATFTRRFGHERFVLGDATDSHLLRDVAGRPGMLGILFTLDCHLYSTINRSSIKHGAKDVKHSRQLPRVGELQHMIQQLGLQVAGENTRGAAVEMRRTFDHVTCMFGSAFGYRSSRPRVLGTDRPLRVVSTDAQRRLEAGTCNGMHRRMPLLDEHDRPCRTHCCRGNTVPIHGKSQPPMPIGLLNQALGFESNAMPWSDLTQSLPPAYASIIFMHFLMQHFHETRGMPDFSLNAIADSHQPIEECLPMQQLTTWATSIGMREVFERLVHTHFKSDAALPQYVAGKEAMTQTAWMDALNIADKGRPVLGHAASTTVRPSTSIRLPMSGASHDVRWLRSSGRRVGMADRASRIIARQWRARARPRGSHTFPSIAACMSARAAGQYRRHVAASFITRWWRSRCLRAVSSSRQSGQRVAALCAPMASDGDLSDLGPEAREALGRVRRIIDDIEAKMKQRRFELRHFINHSPDAAAHARREEMTRQHLADLSAVAKAESTLASQLGVTSDLTPAQHESIIQSRQALAALSAHEGTDSLRDVNTDTSAAMFLTEASLLHAGTGKLELLGDVLLDGGAFRSLISRSRLQRYINIAGPSIQFAPCTPIRLAAETVGGNPPCVIGNALISIHISGRRFDIDVPVVEEGDIFIMGNEFSNSRVQKIDYLNQNITIKHCPDHAQRCETFVTPMNTVRNDVMATLSIKRWSCLAEKVHEEVRKYVVYASSSTRITKWSRRKIRLKVPRGVEPGTDVYVSRLRDGPARTTARVQEGFFKVQGEAGKCYVELYAQNASTSSDTYVSDCEPLAELWIKPEHLSSEAVADMTLEEVVEHVYFNSDLPMEEKDKFLPMLAARLHYFSLVRIGRIHGVECKIDMPRVDSGEVPPPFSKARSLNPEQYAAARKEFDKLLAQGLLTPAPGGGFGSPIVMVKKPKGDGRGGVAWRMAIDFRAVNSHSLPDSYPLPNPVEALAAFGRAKWFTTLDLSSAFHQLPLRECDKIKTTISFPWGPYYYETMPFGLRGASSAFQRMMDAVLVNLAWSPGTTDAYCCVAYVDDVIIFSDTLEQHVLDVGKVLDRMGGSGMVFSPRKCHFAMREVEFLGHVVCAEGTRVVESKVKAILDLIPGDVPDSIRSLERFVSMAQWYMRFMSNFSTVAKPLRNAMSSNDSSRASLGTLAVRAAVVEIKRMLTNAPVLMRADLLKQFHLHVDSAVHSGVGAVLSQVSEEDNELHPTGYYSYCFTEEEQRWSVTQSECAGMLEAVDSFRNLIICSPFPTIVYTDHTSLKYLLTAKRLSDVLTRYAMRLSEYNIEIRYVPGNAKHMLVPDAIGRLCSAPAHGTRPPEVFQRRRGVWSSLQGNADPISYTSISLVLLDSSMQRILTLQSDDGVALPTFLKPVKHKLGVKQVVPVPLSRALKRLVQDMQQHEPLFTADDDLPLDQICVGDTTYVFKPLVFQPKGVKLRLRDMHEVAMLPEVHPCLQQLLEVWRVAVRNRESPLPHPSQRRRPNTAERALAAARLTTAFRAYVQRKLSAGPSKRRNVKPASAHALAMGHISAAHSLAMGHIIRQANVGNPRARNASRNGPSTRAVASRRLSLIPVIRGDHAIVSDGAHVRFVTTDVLSSDGASAFDNALCRIAAKLGLAQHVLFEGLANATHSVWQPPWHFLIMDLSDAFPTEPAAMEFYLANTYPKLTLAPLDADERQAPVTGGERAVWGLLRHYRSSASQRQRDEYCNAVSRTSAQLPPVGTIHGEHDAVVAATIAAPGATQGTFYVRDTAMAKFALRCMQQHFQRPCVGNRRHVMVVDLEGLLRIHGRIDLVQINFGQYTFVFDMVYTPALTAFTFSQQTWELPTVTRWLCDSNIDTIYHSGFGDLAVLHAVFGAHVKHPFDTCVADTALRGSSDQQALDAVLSRWCGISMPGKHDFVHTDTKWRERPLTEEAWKYAIADVAHCSALYEEQRAACIRQGILDLVSIRSASFEPRYQFETMLMPKVGESLIAAQDADGSLSLLRHNALVEDGRQPRPVDAVAAVKALWRQVFNTHTSRGYKATFGKAIKLGQYMAFAPNIDASRLGELPMLDTCCLTTLQLKQEIVPHFAKQQDRAAVEYLLTSLNRSKGESGKDNPAPTNAPTNTSTDPVIASVAAKGLMDGQCARAGDLASVQGSHVTTSNDSVLPSADEGPVDVTSEEMLGSLCLLSSMPTLSPEPTHCAIIVRDQSWALIVHKRVTGSELRCTFPRQRITNFNQRHVTARQALLSIVGPLERTSLAVSIAVKRLRFLRRTGDTDFFECFVPGLADNAVAIHAAWIQRVSTPTDVKRWPSFELMPISALNDGLTAAEDKVAIGNLSTWSETDRVRAVLQRGLKATREMILQQGPQRPHAFKGLLQHAAATRVQAVARACLACKRQARTAPAGSSLWHNIRRRGIYARWNMQQGPLILQQGPYCVQQSIALMKERRALACVVGDFADRGAAPERAEQIGISLAAVSEPTQAMPEGGAVGEATALAAELASVARRALVHAQRSKFSPPTSPLPDDPVITDDDNTQAARTRVPGWIPGMSNTVFRDMQEKDSYILPIRTLLEHLCTHRLEGSDFAKLTSDGSQFILKQGLVFRLIVHRQTGQRLEQAVIPLELRNAVMHAYHDRAGHAGHKACERRLLQHVWWPNMRTQTKQYIRRCSTCGFTKLTRVQAGEARTVGNGDHPGDVWTFDITYIEKRHNIPEASELYHPRILLCFICRASRFAEAFELEEDPTSDEVIDIFVREIVRRYSFPRAMTCDRGTNLMQGEAPGFYKSMGVQLVPSDSHMHNVAGLVERFNASIKDLLKVYMQDTHDEDVIGPRWWRYLPYALLAHNSTINGDTGYSPFYLMYGRDPNLPLQNTLLPYDVERHCDASAYVQTHLKSLHQAWTASREALAANAAAVRDRLNLSRDVEFKLSVGDRVLIKKPNYSGLEVPYHGPYRVSAVLPNDRVQIRDLHRVMHDCFHISRLKLYPYVDNDGNMAANSDEYLIENIRAHRRTSHGEHEYLIKWVGFNQTYNTWLHEADLNVAALELVAAYWKLHRKEPDITASTSSAATTNKVPTFRSHEKHHRDAAPDDFQPDGAAPPPLSRRQARKQRANAASAAADAASSAIDVGAATATPATSSADHAAEPTATGAHISQRLSRRGRRTQRPYQAHVGSRAPSQRQ